jgi:hypothetical protein
VRVITREGIPPEFSGAIPFRSTGHHALRIIPRIREMTANTINMWIKPPTLYTNTPRSQPISRITARR